MSCYCHLTPIFSYFFDDRTQTGATWIDFVVLANKFENYMDFMNEGMMVLCVREEETIEEIHRSVQVQGA